MKTKVVAPMTPIELRTLNDRFDELQKQGIGPCTSMHQVAAEHRLEQLNDDGDSGLFENPGGRLATCWYDDVSKFGFDDQIEIWE